MTRLVEAEMSTARVMVAQFRAQIFEFEGMNRRQRRSERGRDLSRRIDQLRAGLATWEQKVRDLGGESA